MKRVFVTAAAMLMVLAGPVVPPAEAATCYGYNPCNACKNCKYCKHCAKEGGTCGVCRTNNSSRPQTPLLR